MKVRDTISYLLAFDHWKGYNRRERALMESLEEKLGRPSLPIAGGLEFTTRVYTDRLKVFYGYPVKLFLRLSGIDYAYRRYIINRLIQK